MRKRRSEIADKIMQDYFAELRWKHRMIEMQQKKEEKKKKEINDTR